MSYTETLHVVTCLSNPLGWESRDRNLARALDNWLSDPHVHVTLVECIQPGQKMRSPDVRLASNLISVKATTLCWNKESLLNIGIDSLPPDAQFIATLDSDIIFNEPNWALDIVNSLRLYDVVQPWMLAFDNGPDGTPMQVHHSLASLATDPRMSMVEPFIGFWSDQDGKERYGHPGYAWAWRRDFLYKTHGLFDIGCLGSGDRHMAFSLIKRAEVSMPPELQGNYRRALLSWQSAALMQNPSFGFVPLTIKHQFHGEKAKRQYKDRWHILADNHYDPYFDVTRNEFGVLELRNPEGPLAQDIATYFLSRDEDATTLAAAE